MTSNALRKTKDAPVEVSHNVAGQRLGRKGQETRERILAAALRLLDDPDGPAVTLTSVARAADVRLTNLYLYFPDFGELLLAALTRVMDDADAAYMDLLRARWPDDRLGECCLEFLRAHHRFWKRHARLLHLRNAHSDSDPRVMAYRQDATRPLLHFLVLQMEGSESRDHVCANLATVVMTGFERIATVVTNPHFHVMARDHGDRTDEELIDQLIIAEARLLFLAIQDRRAAARS